MDSSSSAQSPLGKRKRSSDESDDDSDGLFVSQASDDAKPDVSHLNNDNVDNKTNATNENNVEEDDDDDDEDEEMELDDSTYHEGKEGFPACAAYDDDFEDIQQRLFKLCVETQGVLRDKACISEVVENLRKRAEEVSSIPKPKPLMIGLLGEAGAGKSSLLNSITDIPELAKALDSGHSCTYVATLYQSAPPNQIKKFSATIEYFDLQTVSTILVSCLNDWASWRFDDKTDWDNELKEQCQRRADTCMSTFRALFCKSDAFQDTKSAAACLDTFVKDGLGMPEKVRVYVDLAQMFLEPKEDDDGMYKDYFEMDDQEDLRETIDPLLMESTTYDESTLWPLVKQVTIGIRGSMVLDRHTIADLPGISDTNQVRVKATYEHIDQCNEIWVVGRCGRIITDTMVDSLLQRYGTANDGHVAVIATKSDENADGRELAKELQRKGRDLGNYDELSNKIRNVESIIKNLKRFKKKAATKQIGQSQETQTNIEESENMLATLTTQRFELLVAVRNEYIKDTLVRSRRQHIPNGGPLNVFCVSNLHYAAHKGAVSKPQPLLDIKMTGIPTIRAYALSLAAPKLFRAVEDFMKTDFSLFFSGLDLWANKEVINGRQHLLEIVEKPAAVIEHIMDSHDHFLMRVVDTKLTTPIRDQQQSCVTKALAYLEQLKKWHFSTIRAFIRRHGNHATATMPKQSWNQRFAEGCTEVISAAWADFLKELREHQTGVENGIVLGMRNVLQSLRGDPVTLTLPMAKFEEAFEAHIDGVRNYNRDYTENLVQDLGSIYDKATTDRPDGYFFQLMEDCYDQCMEDSGPGVKARNMAAFHRDLTLPGDRSPFALLAEEIRSSILVAAQNRSQILQEGLEKTARDLVNHFDPMISSKADDPSEIPVREAVQKYMIKARPKFEQIKHDLQDLKRRYSY